MKQDDVKEIKAKCLSNPEKNLWKSVTKNMEEVKNIFNSIKDLKYEDKPDYEYIKNQIKTLHAKVSLNPVKNTISISNTKYSIKQCNKSKKRYHMDDESSLTKKIQGHIIMKSPNNYIEQEFPYNMPQTTDIIPITNEKRQPCNISIENASHTTVLPSIDYIYPQFSSEYMPNGQAFQCSALYQPEYIQRPSYMSQCVQSYNGCPMHICRSLIMNQIGNNSYYMPSTMMSPQYLSLPISGQNDKRKDFVPDVNKL